MLASQETGKSVVENVMPTGEQFIAAANAPAESTSVAVTFTPTDNEFCFVTSASFHFAVFIVSGGRSAAARSHCCGFELTVNWAGPGVRCGKCQRPQLYESDAIYFWDDVAADDDQFREWLAALMTHTMDPLSATLLAGQLAGKAAGVVEDTRIAMLSAEDTRDGELRRSIVLNDCRRLADSYSTPVA